MKKITRFALGVLSAAVLLTSCSDDDDDHVHDHEHEEEVITSLIYTLTPQGTGDDVVFSFRDLDGDGGNAPIITEGVLEAKTQYSGTIEVLNESEDPAEDITEEVIAEAEAHQFFFITEQSSLTITYSDVDENGNPMGVQTVATAADATDGTLTIVLRHDPDKGAAGVPGGDISNAGGETDIEVVFNVEIQ